MRKLGKCKKCGKLVYQRYSNTWRGRIPQFRIVKGIGVFHASCWRDYKKALVSRKITTFETPNTPFGKASHSEEHW